MQTPRASKGNVPGKGLKPTLKRADARRERAERRYRSLLALGIASFFLGGIGIPSALLSPALAQTELSKLATPWGLTIVGGGTSVLWASIVLGFFKQAWRQLGIVEALEAEAQRTSVMNDLDSDPEHASPLLSMISPGYDLGTTKSVATAPETEESKQGWLFSRREYRRWLAHKADSKSSENSANSESERPN